MNAMHVVTGTKLPDEASKIMLLHGHDCQQLSVDVQKSPDGSQDALSQDVPARDQLCEAGLAVEPREVALSACQSECQSLVTHQPLQPNASDSQCEVGLSVDLPECARSACQPDYLIPNVANPTFQPNVSDSQCEFCLSVDPLGGAHPACQPECAIPNVVNQTFQFENVQITKEDMVNIESEDVGNLIFDQDLLDFQDTIIAEEVITNILEDTFEYLDDDEVAQLTTSMCDDESEAEPVGDPVRSRPNHNASAAESILTNHQNRAASGSGMTVEERANSVDKQNQRELDEAVKESQPKEVSQLTNSMSDGEYSAKSVDGLEQIKDYQPNARLDETIPTEANLDIFKLFDFQGKVGSNS